MSGDFMHGLMIGALAEALWALLILYICKRLFGVPAGDTNDEG